ncbi:MAG: hypothetical protein JNL60_02905, partial [Bacteroidia bacterium]|nr:hypothetical protein [Bacteroidia bacterium]
MNKKLRYFFASLLLCLCFPSFSQNENKKWYFGLYAGLDFMTSPPTALNNGTLVSSWGSASVADANGNLLFYTTGDTIFNQNHVVMANGGIGNGNVSSLESALIIKLPGSTSQYYVFALNAPTANAFSLNYSIVDMSLAAGFGS